MARLKKNNAEYFSHDADMRNDIKIKALRRRFSHMGYAVWNYLLETLTHENEFELDFCDMSVELLAADFEVTVEQLQAIVEYCLSLGLFQMTDNGCLYSRTLKQRFETIEQLRDKRSKAGKSGMESRWNKDSDNKVITPDNKAITPDNKVITTDNKVKESKEKESKEKESKGEETKEKYPYQDIRDLWNSICVSLPKVQKLNDDRRTKIKCRCDEWGKDRETWLRTAEDIFKRIQVSDFLTGRQSDKREWTATFDWIFGNGSNWIKVQEGNYDNDLGGCGSQDGATAAKVALGVGEFYDNSGRRTYGSGKAIIPPTAPPRPSDRHAWDSSSNTWILL